MPILSKNAHQHTVDELENKHHNSKSRCAVYSLLRHLDISGPLACNNHGLDAEENEEDKACVYSPPIQNVDENQNKL